VPYKLLRKYEQCQTPCHAYLECLGNMVVAGDDSDIHNYTTKWLEIVDRGGLFPVNDDSFLFFFSDRIKFSKITYLYLQKHIAGGKY